MTNCTTLHSGLGVATFRDTPFAPRSERSPLVELRLRDRKQRILHEGSDLKPERCESWAHGLSIEVIHIPSHSNWRRFKLFGLGIATESRDLRQVHARHRPAPNSPFNGWPHLVGSEQVSSQAATRADALPSGFFEVTQIANTSVCAGQSGTPKKIQ